MNSHSQTALESPPAHQVLGYYTDPEDADIFDHWTDARWVAENTAPSTSTFTSDPPQRTMMLAEMITSINNTIDIATLLGMDQETFLQHRHRLEARIAEVLEEEQEALVHQLYSRKTA